MVNANTLAQGENKDGNNPNSPSESVSEQDLDKRIKHIEAILSVKQNVTAKEIKKHIEDLGDEDFETRERASKELERLGEAAIPALEEAKKSDDIEVRHRAQDVLEKVYFIRDDLNKIRLLGAKAEKAIPALIAVIKKDTNEQNKYIAAVVLRDIIPESKEYVPALIPLLNDKAIDNEIKASIARALGRVGPKADMAAPTLLKILEEGKGNNENNTVRGAAAFALAKINPKKDKDKMVAALIAVLEDSRHEHVSVRNSAAMALGNIGPVTENVVPALLNVLRNSDGYVSRSAAFALGEIGPNTKNTNEVVDALIEGLNKAKDSNEFAPLEIVAALGKMGKAAEKGVPDLEKYKKQAESNRDPEATYSHELKLINVIDEALKSIKESSGHTGLLLPGNIKETIPTAAPSPYYPENYVSAATPPNMVPAKPAGKYTPFL